MLISFLLGITSHIPSRVEERVRVVERQEAVHSFDIGEEIVSGVNSVTNGMILKGTMDSKETCDSTIERSVDFHVNHTTTYPHRPSGQHLLIDLLHVSSSFLNSESQLAAAMVSLITASGLTLLSYHCHSLQPMGVSCVGVLLESHVSFHTWPTEGVITLDLFTCGSASLLPSVSLIQELFGVKSDAKDEIVTKWSHELRGFRIKQERMDHVLDNTNDLANDLLSSLDARKEMVWSERTEWGQVDVWDVRDEEDHLTWEEVEKMRLREGDEAWSVGGTGELMRSLYINGKAQTSQQEHREFYESFIHPALLIHKDPRNILLLNSIKGSSLQEVLKWDTIYNVLVVDPDYRLLTVIKEHMPFMMDCSTIVDSTASCYDDDRVWLYHEDPKQWLELYAEDVNSVPHHVDYNTEGPYPLPEKLDIVYLDPVDHFYARDIESQFFQDVSFLDSVYMSLTEDGIFVIQIGLVPSIHDPATGSNYSRENILRTIEKHPMTQAMLVYEEPHVGFEEPTAFLIACKTSRCRNDWYQNALQVDYHLRYNLRDSTDTQPLLVHYDGSTQKQYQYPSRGWEVVYCKRNPMPVECSHIGLDVNRMIFTMDIEEMQKSHFEVIVEDDEYTIVSKVFIREGSYIMPDSVSSNYWIHQQSQDTLKEVASIRHTGKISIIQDFVKYVENHGRRTNLPGIQTNHVEVSWSSLIKRSDEQRRVNVGKWITNVSVPVYSPVWERNWESFDVFLISQRDINVGEELIRRLDE